jgi:light-regulated signal transduction histidine kinase (bacteriophytochrome)
VHARHLKFLIAQSLAEEAPRIAELLRQGGYEIEWVIQTHDQTNGRTDGRSDGGADGGTGVDTGEPWDLLFPEYREQLRATNEELREKVRQLERSNTDLEQFAWAASHDLKEPLRTITGYTRLLIRRRRKNTASAARREDGPISHEDVEGGNHETQVGNQEETVEFARCIEQGAERMGGLIDALLAYSRAMHQPLGPDHVIDAQGAAEEAARALRAAIEENSATVSIDPLPPVCAEAAPLAQIFQNLVANALKYRHPEMAPSVHISAVTRGEEVRFSVRDNGIGIASEHYDRVFDVFRRLHGEDYEGLGIGLAICKRLVERYGGRIWLDSEVGAGSTFYFTLRAAGQARVAGR